MKGEGMPVKIEAGDPTEMTNHLKPFSALEKGDLFVKFDIHFPNSLGVDNKNKIVALLRQNAEETNS